MNQEQWQLEQFEQSRAHLTEVARRMLGSGAEADDAVQETWLRLSRSDTERVENMRAWLTTVISRICLDMLRARQARREEFSDAWPAEVVIELDETSDPEREVLLADSVGVAMMVVLDALTPSERLAFVLHDMFGMPFEEIAPIVERSVPATRQLASRGRRRVRGAEAPASRNRAQQRRVVEAFLAAAREGDFEALLKVLDPDVVFRGEAGVSGPAVPREVRGAEDVARLVLARGTPLAPYGRPAIVNGRPGAFVAPEGRLVSVVAFRVAGDRVVGMDLLVDPDRLGRIKLP